MFLGHFGLAFAAKKAAPKTSLGTLVFAAQFADLLWPILLLLGLERVRIVPGLLAASPFDFTSYPISHSLVAEFGWGALLGLIYFAFKRDGRMRVARRSLGAHALVARFHRAPAGHADLSRRPQIRTRNVEFHSFDDLSWNTFCLRRASRFTSARLARRIRRENVALWSLIGLLAILYPPSLFGPPPAQRAGPCLERARHLAHGAVGCVGRPASAIRLG